jgi:hypothetical protein
LNLHNGYPSDFLKVLAQFGISLDKFDEWVAGHEAAHCVIAISEGGTVEHVDLGPQVKGSVFERAKTAINGIAAGDSRVKCLLAGPAYDQLLVNSGELAQTAANQLSSDRDEAEKYLRMALNKQPSEDSILIAFCNRKVSELSSTLSAELAPHLVAVKEVILNAMRGGKTMVAGIAILAAYESATKATSGSST